MPVNWRVALKVLGCCHTNELQNCAIMKLHLNASKYVHQNRQYCITELNLSKQLHCQVCTINVQSRIYTKSKKI